MKKERDFLVLHQHKLATVRFFN